MSSGSAAFGPKAITPRVVKLGRRYSLHHATGWVTALSAAPGRADVDYDGFGQAGRVSLAGFTPGQRCLAQGSGLGGGRRSLQADADGRLLLTGLHSGRVAVSWTP